MALKCNNDHGNFLIEAAIAAAILASASLGAMKLSSLNADNEGYQKSMANQQAAINHITQALNYTNTCGTAFAVTPAGGLTVNFDAVAAGPGQVKLGQDVTLVMRGMGAPNDIVGANVTLPAFGLRVRSLKIRDAVLYDDLNNDGISDDGEANYLANVFVQFEKLNTSTWGGRGFPAALAATVVLQTNVDRITAAQPGQVTSCRGLGANREIKEVCEALQCTYFPASKTCKCGEDRAFCEPGSVLKSIEGGPDGRAVCEEMGVTCPPGYGLISAIPGICQVLPTAPIIVQPPAAPVMCPTTTVGNCVYPIAAAGSSYSGSCATPYTGTCSGTCSSTGAWSGLTNTCAALTPCAANGGLLSNTGMQQSPCTGTALYYTWLNNGNPKYPSTSCTVNVSVNPGTGSECPPGGPTMPGQYCVNDAGTNDLWGCYKQVYSSQCCMPP
jgi:hypothetical protein